MEKRYVVPEGMQKWGLEALRVAINGDGLDVVLTEPAISRTEAILRAAIRWLAENPIVPNREQMKRMEAGFSKTTEFALCPAKFAAVEWQRMMFLEEKETPQERMEREVAELTNRYRQEGAGPILLARDAYLAGVAAAKERQ